MKLTRSLNTEGVDEFSGEGKRNKIQPVGSDTNQLGR
jgi:hypothetical protein